MTQSVFLRAPSGQAMPAASVPEFREPAARDLASGPFSSVLERASQPPPTQKDSSPKSGRVRPQQPGVSSEDSSKATRRAPVREKNKREAQADDQSLAGACAVNGQTPKTDDPVEAGSAEVDSQGQEAPVSVAPADAVPATSGDAGTTVSLSASAAVAAKVPMETKVTDPKTATDLKVTTPRATQEPSSATVEAGAGNAAESMLGATAVPEAAPDFIKQLTPSSQPVPEPVALPQAPAPMPIPKEQTPVVGAKEQTPVVGVKEQTPVIKVETVLPNATVANDPAAAVGATSVLTAEVWQASSAETDPNTQVTAPTALATDGAVAAEVPDDIRRIARAVRRSWSDSLENARGIGAAKISETMKTAIKKEEIAGVAQQLLPSATAVSVSALPTLPGAARRSAAGAASPADALSLAGKLATVPARADGTGLENLRDTRGTSPLTRVSELISREVRMFKRAGDDLVEVVLTPDAKTQISLRLQWREGQVEVQARCDLGDYQSLSTQWQQLQTSLAQHGVRLSHLTERATTGFTEFFNNSSFSQPQGGDRRPPTPGSNADSLTPNVPQPAKPAPAKAAARGNRLFDSWA